MKLVFAIVIATLAWEAIAAGFVGQYEAALLGRTFAPVVAALQSR